MTLKPEEMIALNKLLKELADDIPAWEPERDALQARVKELEEALEKIATGKNGAHGCSSHGCLIEKPVGQGTNGHCMCDDRQLRKVLAMCRGVAEMALRKEEG